MKNFQLILIYFRISKFYKNIQYLTWVNKIHKEFNFVI